MTDYAAPDAEIEEESGIWERTVYDIPRKDIQKLARLTKEHAQYIGILLVCFDRFTRPFDENVLQGILPAELRKWQAVHAQVSDAFWPDCCLVRAQKGFRDRVWLWYREVSNG